jgi:hypothetical protein
MFGTDFTVMDPQARVRDRSMTGKSLIMMLSHISSHLRQIQVYGYRVISLTMSRVQVVEVSEMSRLAAHSLRSGFLNSLTTEL